MQKRLTKSAAKVVRHWLHRTLSLAYETWHEHAHAQGRMRGMLGRIAKRWRHREVAEGFLTWREQAGRQRRAGLVLARSLIRWTHRTAAAAFDVWLWVMPSEISHLKEAVEAKKRSRLLLIEGFNQKVRQMETASRVKASAQHQRRCAVSRMRIERRASREAFLAWHHQVQLCIRRSGLATCIHTYVSRLRLAAALQHWHTHSSLARKQQASRRRLVMLLAIVSLLIGLLVLSSVLVASGSDVIIASSPPPGADKSRFPRLRGTFRLMWSFVFEISAAWERALQTWLNAMLPEQESNMIKRRFEELDQNDDHHLSLAEFAVSGIWA